jgi:hypothetical protein
LTIAPRRAEEKSASVAVHTNDPTRPVVTLRVSWRSHSPVEVDPLEIDFGRVRPGESVQRIATVIRHGPSGKDFGIADVTASPTDRVRVVRRGDELAISLTAGMSPGSQHGRISVRPAGQGQDRLNVPLRWHVADVVEVRPRELMAGTGEPGQRVTSRVIVSAEPGTQLDLKNVYWDGAPSEVATGWRKLTADRGVVELAWTLPKAGGFRRGELVIECAKPAPRTFRVPATAYVFADVPSEEGRSRP